jgi:hypothetical protein
MSETSKVPPSDQSSEPSTKYFNFQIKGWAGFDPMDKTLRNVAERIEGGGGFLTLVEVLKVENEIATIDDEEVREYFANLHAAKRLIQNMKELPVNLKEELRAALNPDEQVAPANLKLAPSPPVHNDALSRLKRWP